MKRTDIAVPVALFVYNRTEQLQKTLDGLKDNKIDLLYVFADGPRNQADSKKTDRVRELIDSITWTKVIKVYQDKNIGLGTSVRSGLDTVFKKHEQAIMLEDDIHAAPGFYEFMKSALARYADDESVAAVTGLRYPFDDKALSGYPYDVFFTRRFSSWGWGTWRRFWESVEFAPAKLKESLKRKYHAEQAGDDMPIMIKQLVDGVVYSPWDISCAATLLLNNQYVAWPSYNMVDNTGLLVGTHGTGVPPPWELNWEKRQATDGFKFPPSVKESPAIHAAFLKFFFHHLNPDAKRLDYWWWAVRRPFTWSILPQKKRSGSS